MSTSTDGSQWFRLPADVRPAHYDLTILSDLDLLDFQGAADISLTVLHPTRKLAFNAGKSLELSDVLVSWDDKQERVKPAVDSEHERATVTLGEELPKGAHVTLTAGFRGKIDDSMMGFYRSSWEHEER